MKLSELNDVWERLTQLTEDMGTITMERGRASNVRRGARRALQYLDLVMSDSGIEYHMYDCVWYSNTRPAREYTDNMLKGYPTHPKIMREEYESYAGHFNMSTVERVLAEYGLEHGSRCDIIDYAYRYELVAVVVKASTWGRLLESTFSAFVKGDTGGLLLAASAIGSYNWGIFNREVAVLMVDRVEFVAWLHTMRVCLVKLSKKKKKNNKEWVGYASEVIAECKDNLPTLTPHHTILVSK